MSDCGIIDDMNELVAAYDSLRERCCSGAGADTSELQCFADVVNTVMAETQRLIPEYQLTESPSYPKPTMADCAYTGDNLQAAKRWIENISCGDCGDLPATVWATFPAESGECVPACYPAPAASVMLMLKSRGYHDCYYEGEDENFLYRIEMNWSTGDEIGQHQFQMYAQPKGTSLLCWLSTRKDQSPAGSYSASYSCWGDDPAEVTLANPGAPLSSPALRFGLPSVIVPERMREMGMDELEAEIRLLPEPVREAGLAVIERERALIRDGKQCCGGSASIGRVRLWLAKHEVTNG